MQIRYNAHFKIVVILIALLLISMLSYATASAAVEAEVAAVSTASVSVSSGNAVAGATIDVTVSLGANSGGISSLFLTLGYDPAVLERVSVTPATLLPMPTQPSAGANPFELNFIDFGDPTAAVTGTGTLATVRFRVLSNAPNGSTPLTLTVASAYRTVNLEPVEVNVTATSGAITVSGGTQPVSPTGVSVAARNNATTVPRGQSHFNATVTPSQAPQTVEWSVSGHAGATINQNGRLNVGANVPLNTQLTITATATGTTISGTTTVTVAAAGAAPPPGTPGADDAEIQSQLAAGAAEITLSGGSITLVRATLDALIEAEQDLHLNRSPLRVVLPVEFLTELRGRGTSFNINTAATNNTTFSISFAANGSNITNFTAEYHILSSVNTQAFTGNLYQVSAVVGGRNIGGSFNAAGNTFAVSTNLTGAFTISTVDNLRRLRLTLGSPLINDLARDTSVTMDTVPLIQQGRTLVPVRFIAEKLGGTANWNPVTRTVTINLDNQAITLVIGQTAPGMDIPAQIIDGRTMVPLRFVSERFGAAVGWDDVTRVIEVVR